MTGTPSFFDRYTIIQQIPIFSKLNWFDLQKIAHKAQLCEYKKGEQIRNQGDPPDYFYCVVSGRIQAYAHDAAGHKTNVEFLHRGMYFGIISLFTGEGHSLSFQAINTTVVLQIEKDDFHNIVQNVPQLGLMFSRRLSQRLRHKNFPVKRIFESTIVSVYSPVKGTGSSTYALNLALSLKRETDKKVILVNIVPSYYYADGKGPDLDAMLACPQWKQTPLNLKDIVGDYGKIIARVATGAIDVDRLNVSFDPNDEQIKRQISHFVTTLVNDYHYVVVDLPNEMDEIVLETLTQSDLIHIVTQTGPDDIRQTRQVLDKLETSLKENFNHDNILVLVSGQEGAGFLSYEYLNRQLDYDVFAKLGNIESTDLTHAMESEDLFVRVPGPESQYAREVRKIARKIGNVMVGLVLGGGAALGLAHIGILKVLEEERIPVDIVVGSSMGALLGAFWTVGMSVREISLLAHEFDRKVKCLKLFDPIIPISGFMAGGAIKRWLLRKIGHKNFYSTRIPLKIVSYDLVKRQEQVLGSGSIVDAVCQSIAIPGIIKPVLVNDKIIIDGGVLNPLPTNVLVALGVHKIIAINVLQSPADVTQGYAARLQKEKEKLKCPFWMRPLYFFAVRLKRGMKRIFYPGISDIIVNSLQASEYVIAQESARHADVVIHPDLSDFNWFELYKVDELIDKGEDAARKALPQILQLVRN